MKGNRIRIEPFNMLNLLSYHGVKEENEHGSVTLSGIIEAKKTEEYLALLRQNTGVTITVSEEQESCIIFQGIITGASIEQEGASSILSLELKTGTYMMENKRHIRSYQEESLTYKSIIKDILINYEQSNMIMTATDQKCGFMLQYEESDWSFLKRAASCMNTVIITDSVTGGVRFFCGVPKRNIAGKINTKTYQMRKSLKEYAIKKNSGLSDFMEEEACYYILKLREIYDLGDEILLNGVSMNICKVISDMEGAELYHTYYLKRATGFRVAKTYNQNVTGVSLMGQVTAVQGTRVKIKLREDENIAGSGERWFDFSTPYSSMGGAGFYCMPEKGDDIRLYFPTQDESAAYVISSVNKEERKDPSIKSIMNRDGKQVILAPSYIKLTNNAGMTLELNDQSGVKVESNGSVTIKASGNLDITSKSAGVTLSAQNKVLLKQGDTVLNLAGDISLQGAKVNLN